MTDLPKDPMARRMRYGMQGHEPEKPSPIPEPEESDTTLGKATLIHGMGGYEPVQSKKK